MRKYILIISVLITCTVSNANSTQLDYIVEYGRIWGFLRYYHPKIQKGQIDWDSVFLKDYEGIKTETNDRGYINTINNLKLELGAVKKLSRPFKYLKTDSVVINLDFAWIANSTLLNDDLKEWLLGVIENYKPHKNVYFARDNTTYRYATVSENWNDYYKKNREIPSVAEGEAMLSVFKYWNRINYCFAYKNLLETPWDSTLIEFVAKIVNSNSEGAVIDLVDLTSRINDCHGTFYSPFSYKYLKHNLPSVDLRCAEGKTIISDVNSNLSGFYNLYKGDIVDSINNFSVAEYRNQIAKFTGCSTKEGIVRNQNYHLLFSKYNDTITYTLTDSAGRKKRVGVYYIKDLSQKVNSTPVGLSKDKEVDASRLIDGKYCYLNTALMDQKALRKALKKRNSYEALIIDNRGHGRLSLFHYARYLDYNRDTIFFQYYEMNRRFPGVYKRKVCGVYRPKNIPFQLHLPKRKYKGPVIVLVDEHTQSTMELQTMWARCSCNAFIVGRPTAGADGAKKNFLVNPFLGASYTEDAVFWPDGGQTQRIGIIPDRIVEPTIESIRKGQDEILWGAIEYLRSNTKTNR